MSTQNLFYVEENYGTTVTLYWSDADINQPHLGDDWDDAPYEYNAGPPYDDSYFLTIERVRRMTIHNLTIDLGHLPGLTFPRNHNGEVLNSGYSINMINKGIVPWLKCGNCTLYAGTTVQEFHDFKNCVQAAITIQRVFRGFLGRRVATELRYRPGAIGFLEAKAEFEGACPKKKRRRRRTYLAVARGYLP